jgi:hypothetical protein
VGDTPFGNSFDLPLTGNNQSATVTETVHITLLGTQGEVLKQDTSNPVALLKTANLLNRINGRLFTRTSMTFDLDFSDEKTHRVSLYALDSENQKRIQSIQIVDPITGQAVASTLMANFQKGKYATFEVKGHVQILVTRLAGKTAVINGMFFD